MHMNIIQMLHASVKSHLPDPVNLWNIAIARFNCMTHAQYWAGMQTLSILTLTPIISDSEALTHNGEFEHASARYGAHQVIGLIIYSRAITGHYMNIISTYAQPVFRPTGHIEVSKPRYIQTYRSSMAM